MEIRVTSNESDFVFTRLRKVLDGIKIEVGNFNKSEGFALLACAGSGATTSVKVEQEISRKDEGKFILNCLRTLIDLATVYESIESTNNKTRFEYDQSRLRAMVEKFSDQLPEDLVEQINTIASTTYEAYVNEVQSSVYGGATTYPITKVRKLLDTAMDDNAEVSSYIQTPRDERGERPSILLANDSLSDQNLDDELKVDLKRRMLNAGFELVNASSLPPQLKSKIATFVNLDTTTDNEIIYVLDNLLDSAGLPGGNAVTLLANAFDDVLKISSGSYIIAVNDKDFSQLSEEAKILFKSFFMATDQTDRFELDHKSLTSGLLYLNRSVRRYKSADLAASLLNELSQILKDSTIQTPSEKFVDLIDHNLKPRSRDNGSEFTDPEDIANSYKTSRIVSFHSLATSLYEGIKLSKNGQSAANPEIDRGISTAEIFRDYLITKYNIDIFSPATDAFPILDNHGYRHQCFAYKVASASENTEQTDRYLLLTSFGDQGYVDNQAYCQLLDGSLDGYMMDNHPNRWNARNNSLRTSLPFKNIEDWRENLESQVWANCN